jgi:glucan phosphoethanolaminetransferase (alkaline phosphatase superfamily)
MEGYEIGVAIVTVLAFVLLIISLIAYKRERTGKFLLTALVFLIFLIKGLIMTLSIFTSHFKNDSDILMYSVFLDVVILLFLFFAGLRPPRSEKKPKSESKKLQGY